MTGKPPRDLIAVWNPSYAQDALENTCASSSTGTCASAKPVRRGWNALQFARIRKTFSKGNPVGRVTRVNDTEIDLGGNVPHQTLGALVMLLKHNRDVQGAVKVVFQKTDVDDILGELPSHLEPIAAVRNPAAHSGRVKRDACVKLRETIVGIGQEGLIARLARTKMR